MFDGEPSVTATGEINQDMAWKQIADIVHGKHRNALLDR
jgi:hypothetical protein